ADTVERSIHSLFVVSSRDDKSYRLSPDQLGYQGIHFDVKLSSQDSQGVQSGARSLRCEIQLQTQAQRLWADLSHPLLYKSPAQLPVSIQRKAYGLVALLEVVDDRVDL